MREELSTILSNRSAAFLEAGDYVSALADAEVVIQVKRPWSKGHFRKAKALIALEEYREARDAINLGLQFDPKNAVRGVFFSLPLKYGIKDITAGNERILSRN
jgi:translocation protein SEC72